MEKRSLGYGEMNNYTDTLITYLQIFGIGFSFGLWGPCVWNYFILSSFFVNLKEAKETSPELEELIKKDKKLNKIYED